MAEPNWQDIEQKYQAGQLPPDQRSAYEELKARGAIPAAPAGPALKSPMAPVPKDYQPPAEPDKFTAAQKAEDFARSIPTGLEKGLIGMVTAPPTLTQMGGSLANEYLPEGITAPVAKGAEWAKSHVPGAGLLLDPKYAYPNVQSKIEESAKATGQPIWQPKTGWGQGAELGASFIPALMAGAPETLPMRGAQALGSASAAGLASEAVKGTPAEQYSPAIEMAAALLGHKLGPRAITPFPVKDPEYASSVKLLTDKNMPLTPARATGSEFLAQRESNLGPRVTGGADEAKNFSAAVMRELGSNNPRATFENLGDLQQQFQQKYNSFFNNRTMPYSPTFIPGAEKIVRDYTRKAGANFSPAVQNALDTFKFDALKGKINPNWQLTGMSGTRYQHVLDTLQRSINSAGSDLEKNALIKLHDHLENEMRGSLSLQDRDNFDTLNKQYANWNLIANSKIPTDKYLTPESLAAAVASQRGNRAFNLGRGTLAQLAHAGSEVLGDRPPPISPEKASLRPLLAGAGAAAGYRYGGLGEGMTAAILGHMIGGEDLTAYLTKLARSRPMQAAYNAAAPYLSNQALVPRQPMSETERFARVLANMGGQPTNPTAQPPQ